MVKSKFAVLAASASLVATLGLAACGGQNASSSSAAASSSSEATSTTASSSASTSAADKKIVSWEGMLTDGNLVSYMNSEDGKQATLTITNTKTNDVKSWTGASTINGDKITITDDKSKEAVTFTLTTLVENGVMAIDIEGQGAGAVVAFTAADYKMMEDFQKTLDDASKVSSWEGALADGSLVSCMNSEDGKQAALSITNLNTGETKTWMGATTIEGDKITITDTESKNTITINVSSVKEEDGTAEIEIEGYGKGTVVAFTAGEYQLLGEAEKALAEAAKTAK